MAIRSTTWFAPEAAGRELAPAPSDSPEGRPPADAPVVGLKSRYGNYVLLVVVLDVSHSVFAEQQRVEALVREMLDEIRRDTLAAVTVRIAFVIFSDRAETTRFALAQDASCPTLTFGGSTAFWAAMRAACDLVVAEVERLGAEGESVQKILVPVVSDFCATDEPGGTPAYVHKTEARVRMNLLPIAAGPTPNMAVANKLSRKRPAVRMDDAKVREMFQFISESAVMASASQPGEAMDLPVDKLNAFLRAD